MRRIMIFLMIVAVVLVGAGCDGGGSDNGEPVDEGGPVDVEEDGPLPETEEPNEGGGRLPSDE
jgi:hypothetical protein